MGIIDRYIARSYLSSYVILIVIGIGLYVLFDLLGNVDEFVRDPGTPLTRMFVTIFDYYGSNVPLYYDQLTAPIMAIAAAFTLGFMLRNNEFTALVAAGRNLARLAVPVVYCTLLLVVVSVVNREIVIPSLAERIGRTRQDVVLDHATSVPIARDADGVLLTASRALRGAERLEEVYFVETDAAGNPVAIVQADAAEYDRTTAGWRLERGRRFRMAPPDAGAAATIEPEAVVAIDFGLAPGEIVLRRNAQWADYLSLVELTRLLETSNLPNKAAINMARHVRLTQPLAQLLLVLLVIPFFLTRERANVLVAGLWALVVGGSYFAVLFVSQHILAGSTYDDMVAWAPLILFGPLAAVALINIRT